MLRASLMTMILALSAAAQSPDTPWVSLFDGKDLNGWTKVGQEKWEVVDGAIHGQGISGGYGYLRTEKKYKDFEMSVRFRCDADINSGVFYHVDFKPGTADVSQGLQFEIDTRLNHHTGGIYGDDRQWIVWPAPELETVVRPNDWNDFVLKVQANRYIGRLNGVVLVDFTDPTPKSFDGYIALQLHSGQKGSMSFKDIFIRDLTKP